MMFVVTVTYDAGVTETSLAFIIVAACPRCKTNEHMNDYRCVGNCGVVSSMCSTCAYALYIFML